MIGSAAGKLHTGRSRNDQVATDLRLWLRGEIDWLEKLLTDVVKVLIKRAEKEMDVLMPGYTHLQSAQPIRWSHLLCRFFLVDTNCMMIVMMNLFSYASSLLADQQRLQQLKQRVNVLPLGSGALAGNPFPIDRPLLGRLLSFDQISSNSLLAVGDRDFVGNFVIILFI